MWRQIGRCGSTDFGAPVVHLLYTGDTVVIYQYNKDDDDGVGVDYNDNCDEVYGEDNAGMLMTRMRRTLIGIVW